MTWRVVSSGLTVIFLLALGQLLAALKGVPFALFAALPLGLLTPWLLSRLSGTLPLWGWSCPVLSGGATMIGLVPILLMAGGTGALLAAPAVAVLGTCLSALFLRREAPNFCAICRDQLSDVVFTCPRCGWRVCDRFKCWNFNRARCQRCDASKVKLLNTDHAWWLSIFGNPSPQGQCKICLEPPSASQPLFGCPRCRTLQCQRCWDEVNGQCSYCQWIVPELPERMRGYLFASKE
jgi:hypothetical protein